MGVAPQYNSSASDIKISVGTSIRLNNKIREMGRRVAHMERSTFREGEEGRKVAMYAPTAAGFKFQRAIWGLWVSLLKLEKLLNKRRAGRENPDNSISETRCIESGCWTIEVREPFLFQSKRRERKGKKRAGGGERGDRMSGEMRGTKISRNK